MIVIDVGCASHERFDSISLLIDEHQPTVVLGFDPAVEFDCYHQGDALVIEVPYVAWTYWGFVGFHVEGVGGHVEPGALQQFPCFDLAESILTLARHNTEVVLKLDAEGAEYDLLDHLIATGAIEHVSVLWVEWHQPDRGRARIEAALPAAVEQREWTL